MGRIEKLVDKFLSKPKDLSWKELVKVLSYYGFEEITRKGKTGGSRVKFVNEKKHIINLHKPHPGTIVKRYVIVQIIDKLKSWEII
jgi:predicted RNA binding protein YcfA (HicA-like mRNA interferase family)